MSLFTVNEKTCNKDGICAEVCPARVIFFSKGEIPTPVDGASSGCIRCGHCVAACPTGSFSHSEMPVEECPQIRPELELGEEQCEQFLRSRRSIRAYKDKAVPHDTIKRLIEIARYGPTGGNSQRVEWLVLDDKNFLNRISSMMADWMKETIRNDPGSASSMRMERVVKRWDTGYDVYLRGAPVLIIAHAGKDDLSASSSCLIAQTYLELAAPSLGLGACWAGYFMGATRSYEPLIKELPLPEGHLCYAAMMVGYSKFRYHRLPLRLDPPITWA
jgi:nitroreductase/NAD-dependent dihydropyrimidine dehydrogenase PreA subunit